MNETEQAKRDAGQPYVDDAGRLVTRITAPAPPESYQPLAEFPGDIVGLAVIWSGPGGHQRDLRVWDYPQFGRDLGLTNPDSRERLYVPIVPEAAWWAFKLAQTHPDAQVQYVERYSLWVA